MLADSQAIAGRGTRPLQILIVQCQCSAPETSMCGAGGLGRQGSRMLDLLQCAVTPVAEPQLDAESHGDVRRMQQVRKSGCM